MGETKDFLLEIGTEEMPSAPLLKAVAQYKKLIVSGLDEAGLAHGEARIISTPRRLSAYVKDVALATEEINEVMRGPKCEIAFDAEGNPTKAALGFARKASMDASELARRVDDDGHEYVFAQRIIPSVSAIKILSELSERTIPAIDWPRSQRWGSTHERFVRPIRWICALLGTEVVPVTYADVTSSNTTQGHRVLGSGAHVVDEPSHYEQVLEAAYVLSAERRRSVILDGIARIEEERPGFHVDTPQKVLDEVINLTEWPSVLVGTFDEEFLKVPHEIITESMLSNQRYFPIYDANGELTREFVIVSNGNPACSRQVIDGNERVVRARLDDAKFFFEEDLKHSLDEFTGELSDVVFQEKLGTVLQKVERIEKIAAFLAQADSDNDDTVVEHARRAAHLSKADLVSQAVVEFTSQQGVMGGYYAKAAGESPDVADAIREHYRPRFAGDDLPSGPIGRYVAAADKLDTICGLFAIDEPPTGSSDPYAVRRAAIGVIALLRTMPNIRLKDCIRYVLDLYTEQGLQFDTVKVQREVEAYFLGRLVTIARDEKISQEAIDAVAHINVIDPEEFLRRTRALDDARIEDPENFENLAIAYNRASKLGDMSLGTDVNESILTASEQALLDACKEGEKNVQDALMDNDFRSATRALGKLRKPIDKFFDDVLVMDDDTTVRGNRLRLLNRFTQVFEHVADIGALSRKK